MDLPPDDMPRAEPDRPWEDGAVAETHAYVGHASPMTWEGVVEGYGNVARVAKRGTGWRRIAGLAVCIIVLVPFFAGLVALVFGALSKL